MNSSEEGSIIKLWIARLGIWMWERDYLPRTGQVLFEYGEHEHAAYQHRRLLESFEVMQTDPGYSASPANLGAVADIREALEIAVYEKQRIARDAELTNYPELDLAGRSSHYVSITKLEKIMLRWAKRREKTILNMIKE